MRIKGVIKIKLDTRPEVREKLISIWKIFSKYADIHYEVVNENQDLLISEQTGADIPISKVFCKNITASNYDHHQYFDKEPLIYTEANTPDYLGSCFYIINCLQEYNDVTNDKTGRFSYQDSFQSKFSCVEQNLVGNYFDKLIESVPMLNSNVQKSSAPSKYFLSHDNDVLHGSFMQDGLYAIKHGRLDIVLKLIFNEILRKPEWRNMSKIMDIEDEYDVKSTFFWLVDQDTHYGIENADYNINSSAIRKLISEIQNRGWSNGLHKSSSDMSYQDEMDKLGVPVKSNRNHFLRINIPDTYKKIETAGLELDCSVGFAEKIGFRNGYALPFQPYNMNTDKEFNFLEISLHVMDATLYNYEKLPPTEGKQRVLGFLENHKNNSVISILWHNKYFTGYKYKGYLDIYKSILDFMVQNNMSSVSQNELTEQYLDRL